MKRTRASRNILVLVVAAPYTLVVASHTASPHSPGAGTVKLFGNDDEGNENLQTGMKEMDDVHFCSKENVLHTWVYYGLFVESVSAFFLSSHLKKLRTQLPLSWPFVLPLWF